jgi:hypothetical protein
VRGLRHSGRQLTPFRECGTEILFGYVAVVEVAVVVEMLVDRRMGGGELL